MEKELKLQKEILRCRKCNKPLAQIKSFGNSDIIRIATNNNGKRGHVIIECHYDSGGLISIECEACQGQISPYQKLTIKVDKENK